MDTLKYTVGSQTCELTMKDFSLLTSCYFDIYYCCINSVTFGNEKLKRMQLKKVFTNARKTIDHKANMKYKSRDLTVYLIGSFKKKNKKNPIVGSV